MNYAKLLSSAMTLFPKRINTTLIDATTGNRLGKYKLPSSMLPAVFDRPTILTIEEKEWRVTQAIPLSADDFAYSKKLTLHVHPAGKAGQFNRFNRPTQCDPLPEATPVMTTGTHRVMIDREDWMQHQFLPLVQAQAVEEAVQGIKGIIDRQSNPLLGYEEQYVRTGFHQPGLSIPWRQWYALLTNPVESTLSLTHEGEVTGGFAVKTESYTYYGQMIDENICTLGISGMEYIDEEIMQVMSVFDLLLVDWCNVSRISAEEGEQPKSEYVSL